jgi:hypothetical protein
MTLAFQTARDCIKDLESKVWKVPYGSGQRPKEKQVQCQACKRWKYGDERCNLFMTTRTADNGTEKQT